MRARPLALRSHFDGAWLVLIALVAALPLLIVPFAADSFVLPKETLSAMAAVLAGALALGALLTGRGKASVRLEPLNAAVLLYALWNWVSVIWAAAPMLAVDAALRTTVYTALFFLFQIVAGGYRSRVVWLLGALAVSSLVISLWVLVQDARAAFFPEGMTVRATLGDWRDALSQAGLGNTSHIGDILALGFLCWISGFTMVRSGWLRWAIVGALVLHAAAMIVTWSVHSNISLVMAACLYVYTIGPANLGRRLNRGLRKWALVLLIGWGAAVAFFAVDHPLNTHGSAVWAGSTQNTGGIFSQAFASSRWTSGLDTRKAIWLTTLEVIRHNPWLGTGAGTFTWSYPAAISPIVQNSETLAPWSGAWTNAAHQEILQVWSETGIVGVALLVVMVALSIRLSWQRLHGGARRLTGLLLTTGLACLVALILQAQMNFPLRMPVGTLHFYLLLVIPLLVPRGDGETYDLDVPVERPYGPVNVGIMMRNMAYPTEVSLRFSLPTAVGLAAALTVGVLAVLVLIPVTAPLRGDLAYRQVREARLRPGSANSQATMAAADRVLAIWPGHVDCRSARQEMLLQAEQWQRVVDETPVVMERLNAVEVYFRRALALEKLGEQQAADRDWREVFRRRPDLAMQFPAAWARVRPPAATTK